MFCLLHISLGSHLAPNSSELIVIKLIVVSLPSQPVLGCYLGVHILKDFFPQQFSWGEGAEHFFLQLGLDLTQEVHV